MPFQEYTDYIAQYNSGDHNDISKAAKEHSNLVGFFKHIADFVDYDYADDYPDVVAYVSSQFDDQRKASTTDMARQRLLKNNHSYNMVPYGSTSKIARELNSKYKHVAGSTRQLLRETITTIVCREKYILEMEAINEDSAYDEEFENAIYSVNRETPHNNTAAVQYVKGKEASAVLAVGAGRYGGDSAVLTITVDDDWFNGIYKNKMSVVEFQGVKGFVVNAKEIDSTNQYTMYEITLASIKGTKEERDSIPPWWSSTTQQRGENIQKLLKIETLALAMDKTSSGIYAVGADAKRAEQTMKMRQKAQMVRNLGL